MKSFTLSNGMEMPALGFGTFQTGGAECENSVKLAVAEGYRLIDTAQAYGNEEYVGRALASCGVPRDRLFLTTKVNFPSYDAAQEVVEASLRKLQTDYIDLMLLHWPFGNYYAAWRVLEKCLEQGKIRAIGISNFDPDRMVDLIQFNKVAPAVNQIEMNLLCQRKAERRWMEKYNVAAMAYAPLGQGKKNEMFENPALREIAAAHEKTPAQIALGFLVQSGAVVIPKSTHENRIRENAAIFDFTLSAAEMEQLAAMDTASPMVGTAENPETVEIAMTW